MNPAYQRPPVRVALMGLGRSMFAEHYPVYRDHPGLFRVVAACDLMKERRDIVAKDFPSCKMFRRFSDMLDERDIDVVDVCTCSVDHCKHAMASLKRGFWTLVESPLALSVEDAQMLRGQAVKSQNRLIVMQRGLFAPDFLLARAAMSDSRLGTVYDVSIRREDFVRRDDWQCVKRLGGGAAYYVMPDLVCQALKLLQLPPIQMWSDLKRVASLGDSEDYAKLCLKTRGLATAEIVFNGGTIGEKRSPSFTVRGERGVFEVMPGATEGKITFIDPAFVFPRRRSSVRTPSMRDMHEQVPVMTDTLSLPKGTAYGPSAFWKHLYDTVRVGAPFPLSLEDSLEALKFSHLMKKTSPFCK